MAKNKCFFLPLLVAVSLGLLIFVPWAGNTGEYHTGDSLLCYDCHTMHFSETQGFSSTDPYGTGTPIQFPLTTGPNPYLLRQPQNAICLSCHDAKTNAPDVLGANINAAPNQGRQAGAVNTVALGAPYETWKGHTVYSTDAPPGYNPSLIGLGNWYTGMTYGLKCIHCHEFHGSPIPYRNLGPSALGPAAASVQPTYVVDTTNDTTKDVWINIPSGYVAGTGNATTFNPYYARANIFFNRNDNTIGSLKTSNKLGSFCATCHANFHGGGGNANIGGTASASNLEGFLRHPAAQATIGAAGGAGYGGHSSLTRFVANTTKVKVNTTNYTTYADASPFCLSCHKGHGNQNPFGLIFLNRNATSVDEEGGWATGQTHDVATGYRNLCGQCHGQGN